jgi:hypothetical protein
MRSRYQRLFQLSRRAHWLVLLAILLAGVAVRASGFGDTTVSFHTTRQMHCALIARALYYRVSRAANDPLRVSAEQAADRRGRLEPPIVQSLAAFGYLVSGSEHLGIARALSACFWLGSACFLYALAARLLSRVAAAVAAAFQLLLPYGVVASQSFQPDPLMILLMVASWYAICVNDAPQRTWRHALIAGAVSGLAVLVKPMSGFSIAFLYLALMLRQPAPWRSLLSLRTWLYGAVLLAPVALYYVREIASGGRLQTQADSSFQPELWHEARFWHGWLDTLLAVLSGKTLLVLAGLGLCLVPRGRVRWVLPALWLSYVAYGLTFTYHISSHDYYHLPFVPVVALSLACLSQRVLNGLRRIRWPVLQAPVLIAALAFMVWVAGVTWSEISETALPRTAARGPNTRELTYRQIGQIVGHSPRVIFVTPNAYGGPLEFYGELSGWYWNTANELRRKLRRGQAIGDPSVGLAELCELGAEYFVSTPADELPKQRVLAQLLSRSYQRVANEPEYVIYDLRRHLAAP